MRKTTYCLIFASLLIFSLSTYGENGSGYDAADLVGVCLEVSNMGRSLCDCMAEKATAEFTPEGYAFLVATLSGDEARADEMRGRLEISEMMQAGMFMANAPARCASEAAGGANEN